MVENRLIRKLQEAKRKKRKIFCTFLTLGYPSLRITEKLIEGMVARGVDAVELGFPFSDPLADGPTIQFSSEEALKGGVEIEDALRTVKNLRKRGVEIPLLFFSYLNPIYHYGITQFPKHLKEAGFDGLVVPDCPPEEDKELWEACERWGIVPIFLVAPTTTPERARKIFARSKGFVYYVSVRGVTGARGSFPADFSANLKKLRQFSLKPILVGFGVSSPDQVKRICRLSDGVIVGSAIIHRIRQAQGRLQPVLSFIEALIRPLRNSKWESS